MLRVVGVAQQFQSALPLRGATWFSVARCCSRTISIRAPLAGSDLEGNLREAGGVDYFNPRSPCGERRERDDLTADEAISIRAPLAGSDSHSGLVEQLMYISIRAPLAGSDMLITYLSRRFSISIRAPLAGSDGEVREVGLKAKISIRAPLAGSDKTVRRAKSET